MLRASSSLAGLDVGSRICAGLERRQSPASATPASLARRRFHCPAREWTLDSAVRLPVLEGVQLSAPEYRSRVYQVLWRRPRTSPSALTLEPLPCLSGPLTLYTCAVHP